MTRLVLSLCLLLSFHTHAGAQCPGGCPCLCGETGICCCDVSLGDVQKSKLLRARLDMNAYRGPRPMPAGRFAWVEDGKPSWTIIPFPAKDGTLAWGPGWFGWPETKRAERPVARNICILCTPDVTSAELEAINRALVVRQAP